eukprot:6208815-Pleurochrysis_carterae.AAC.4
MRARNLEIWRQLASPSRSSSSVVRFSAVALGRAALGANAMRQPSRRARASCRSSCVWGPHGACRLSSQRSDTAHLHAMH